MTMRLVLKCKYCGREFKAAITIQGEGAVHDLQISNSTHACPYCHKMTPIGGPGTRWEKE